MLLRTKIVIQNELFEAFSKVFKWQNDFMQHGFLIHQHLLNAEGGVETQA